MYDSIMITIIAITDIALVWVAWQGLQEKRKSLIKRQVSKLLNSLRSKEVV